MSTSKGSQGQTASLAPITPVRRESSLSDARFQVYAAFLIDERDNRRVQILNPDIFDKPAPRLRFSVTFAGWAQATLYIPVTYRNGDSTEEKLISCEWTSGDNAVSCTGQATEGYGKNSQGERLKAIRLFIRYRGVVMGGPGPKTWVGALHQHQMFQCINSDSREKAGSISQIEIVIGPISKMELIQKISSKFPYRFGYLNQPPRGRFRNAADFRAGYRDIVKDNYDNHKMVLETVYSRLGAMAGSLTALSTTSTSSGAAKPQTYRIQLKVSSHSPQRVCTEKQWQLQAGTKARVCWGKTERKATVTPADMILMQEDQSLVFSGILVLYMHEVPRANEIFQLKPSPDKTTYIREKTTLKVIANILEKKRKASATAHGILATAVLGESMKTADGNTGHGKFIHEKLQEGKLRKALGDGRKLDDSQFSAALLGLIWRFSLIQGPPGTGKTEMAIAMIIAYFVARIEGAPIRPSIRPRVLITAPSNAAVDVLARRLYQALGDHPSQHIRALRNRMVRYAGTSQLGDVEVVVNESKDARKAREKRAMNILRRAEELIEDETDSDDSDSSTRNIEHVIGRQQPPYIKTSEYCGTAKDVLADLRSGLTAHIQLERTSSKEYPDDISIITHRKIKLHHLGEDKIQRYNELESRCLAGVSTKEDIQEYAELCISLDAAIMSQMCIVLCTNAGSMAPSVRFCYNADFHVGDESGQSADPTTLMPIVSMHRTLQQSCWIGDHKQLNPICLYSIVPLSTSTFGRLSDMLNSELWVPNIMLENNYRSVKSIVDYFSRFQYNGKVKATRQELAGQDPLNNHFRRLFGTAKSRLWVDTQGEEDQLPTGSYQNLENSKACGIIVSLLEEMGHQPEEIAVIIPYRGQIGPVRKQIQHYCSSMSQVHVGTVDTFQGSERRIIIVDLVRSHVGKDPSGDLQVGFLTDPHRFNVVVSRPRDKLIFVGNQKTFDRRFFKGKQGCDFLQGMVALCRQEGVIIPLSVVTDAYNEI
ncbi:hypothetical protein TWF718_005727 [Orbilia javanica]|uniref:Uncharacterized protein n=1 Tax=Orbilia javanica TaxID=47235 RepID=A0AAN8RP47_9PEZI